MTDQYVEIPGVSAIVPFVAESFRAYRMISPSIITFDGNDLGGRHYYSHFIAQRTEVWKG